MLLIDSEVVSFRRLPMAISSRDAVSDASRTARSPPSSDAERRHMLHYLYCMYCSSNLLFKHTILGFDYIHASSPCVVSLLFLSSIIVVSVSAFGFGVSRKCWSSSTPSNFKIEDE